MAISATSVAFTPFERAWEPSCGSRGQADALGLDRVQVAEAWSHGATVLLAEVAAQTSRIGLGTGVISVWSRTPASIALAAAGSQRASGGRFSLGLDAGSPPLTEGLHGVRWKRPVTRLRETLLGDVGWVFGAGAGWPADRRHRVKEIIVRQMWPKVDPAQDAEGHLLCEGTALDIAGRNVDRWPAGFRAAVLRRHPRLTLAAEFTAAFEDQAGRKPGCAAAAAVASGLGAAMAANPLE